MNISRRDFLKQASLITLGFSGLRNLEFSHNVFADSNLGFGPLKKDPKGILDLPEGFSYKIISKSGKLMSDKLFVPKAPDGMATFLSESGKTIIIRNHEVNRASTADYGAFGDKNQFVSKINKDFFYDYGYNGNPCLGGTSTIVFDTKTQTVEKEFLSLAGTLRNCAGGPTPWNSWITCEETVDSIDNEHCSKNHGYVFEVEATDEIKIAKPTPIKAMGRFNHEAIAVDPISGIIYLTEDAHDGLLYRYIPNVKEKMLEGGKLQALSVKNLRSFDTRNWEKTSVKVGQIFDVEWIDIKDVDPVNDTIRFEGFENGAAVFARGEGMWFGNDAIYFACTNGGKIKKGQIWRYIPSKYEGKPEENNLPGKLELFVEPNDVSIIDNADNLTVSPWGDLIVCEDGADVQFIIGVTNKGKIYKFAENVVSDSEFAGVTFSPDGSTLFVNIQHDGLTLAITGNWNNRK